MINHSISYNRAGRKTKPRYCCLLFIYHHCFGLLNKTRCFSRWPIPRHVHYSSEAISKIWSIKTTPYNQFWSLFFLLCILWALLFHIVPKISLSLRPFFIRAKFVASRALHSDGGRILEISRNCSNSANCVICIFQKCDFLNIQWFIWLLQ